MSAYSRTIGPALTTGAPGLSIHALRRVGERLMSGTNEVIYLVPFTLDSSRAQHGGLFVHRAPARRLERGLDATFRKLPELAWQSMCVVRLSRLSFLWDQVRFRTS